MKENPREDRNSKAQVVQRQTRNIKSIDTIEEWDCPKPGTRNALPKSVKENIKKNKRKFEEYYKNRIQPDSVQAAPTN
jgi:hypothetical protein